MFGNKALKQYMANQEKQFGKMYHFVKEGDIVPGNLNLDLTYCKDYYVYRWTEHSADFFWKNVH